MAYTKGKGGANVAKATPKRVSSSKNMSTGHVSTGVTKGSHHVAHPVNTPSGPTTSMVPGC